MSATVLKAENKLKEALLQYSKKMCTRVTFFWMIYRIILSILIFFNHDVSTSLVKLTEGVDTVMIINMSVYTMNSVVEKTAGSYFNYKTVQVKAEYNHDDKDEEEEEKDTSVSNG